MIASPIHVLAQSAPAAATLFYLTLLFIFLTAIITTVATKWARDKCLKLFDGHRVTLERVRGQTIWGRLKVFSSGIEVMYDHPFIDTRGRQKNSFMIYQSELELQVHALLRFHGGLDETAKKRRERQIRRTFNPGPLRRAWRGVRNFVNTLRDAFNAAIGAAVSQYQRTNPQSAILSSQGGAVTNIGQTLLGKFANAYEPLLEQYIGRPVILDVADPLNPNNATVEYTGFLVDYSQQFIAVMNVEHDGGEERQVVLPDVERGPSLGPIPPPPPAGGAAFELSPPLLADQDIEVRIDGVRFKIFNICHDPLVVLALEHDGHDPLVLNMTIPPRGTLDLPARDARGARLRVRHVRGVDVVASRRIATVRHAGQQLDPRGLADEFRIDRLPLVSRLFVEKE